jgi:hypothetical protein
MLPHAFPVANRGCQLPLIAGKALHPALKLTALTVLANTLVVDAHAPPPPPAVLGSRFDK